MKVNIVLRIVSYSLLGNSRYGTTQTIYVQFQNNTRSKFTIAKIQTLFFHQFNQSKVSDTAEVLAIAVSKRCTQDLPTCRAF